MIPILKAIILGLVEGATEFIPVSSTGHLILVEDWLNWTDDTAKTFSIFIQLGAILAIVWLYWKKVAGVAFSWYKDEKSLRFVLNLLIAFVPAALVGLLIHGWIKEHLFKPFTVACALVIGGIIILLVEKLKPQPVVEDVDNVPYRKALGIGLAQVLSLFPGVSRSGATIMGAYSLGLSRKAATEFSFFLAIPIMIAATFFDLWESRNVLGTDDIPIFTVGFVVSFLTAVVIVRAFVSFVSRNSFVVFAWYRIIFGLALLVYYTYFAA